MGKFFEKLFGRNKPQQPPTETAPAPSTGGGEEPTIPISDALFDNEEISAIISESEYPNFLVGCAKSVGLQRDHNEDALFAISANLTNKSENSLLGLFMVADGMGGHKHGEIASEIAVRSVGSQVLSKVFTPLLAKDPSPPQESLQEILQESVIEAHNAIVKEALGGGTTLTVVLIINERAIVAHVGDSRAYNLTPDGEIQAITRDHSLVMRMMELGQLSPEEAAIHPQRNVLYRALGQGEPLDPDLHTFPLPGGGHILVCSDGLWNVVPEELITQIVQASPDPQKACEHLVDAANAAGGPDNITVILIRLPD